ncbi:hypothetical protein FRB97_003389 [Tulasnella sp. 331]|nr:hypothetical protein FRB97_003389 [Tulasnella sp. 331]
MDEEKIMAEASTRPPFLSESPLMPSLSTTPSTTNSYSPQTPVSPTTRTFEIAEEDSPTLFTKPDTRNHDMRSSESVTTSDCSDPSVSYHSLTEELEKHESTNAEDISHEIRSANWTIGENGRYLETTSGHAARELKRMYDQRLRVGQDGIRSPFAIDVTQDELGRTMYRVSERPGISAPQNSHRTATEQKTRSRLIRLSVGGFGTKPGKGDAAASSTATSNAPTARKPSNRLVRSVRSTAELRAHAKAGGPSTRYKQPYSSRGLTDEVDALERLGTDSDAFSVLLGWSRHRVTSAASSVGSAHSSSAGSYFSTSHDDETQIPYPFGRNTTYTPPSRPLDVTIRRPVSPPQIRYMQSFESGLTARAEDSERHPTRMVHFRSATRIPSDTHASGSPYFTDVFDVLQNYKGIPLADTLSAVATETTFKLSSTPSAMPKNDPRFVIWGESSPGGDHEDTEATLSDLASASPSSPGQRPNNHRGGSSMLAGSDGAAQAAKVVSHSGGSDTSGAKVIVAATIERWIAQLTSELNYVELLDFFLTYRVYVRAIDLCHLLICRFHWAVKTSMDDQPQRSAQDDTVKKIVRVRTFIAFRYWLSTFFQVDFLKDPELRRLLTTWLNSLKADSDLVGHNADVLDIVRKLKKVVRECKDKWSHESQSSTASSIASDGTREGEARLADPDADVDLDLGQSSPFDNASGSKSAAGTPYSSSSILDPFTISTPRPSDVSTLAPLTTTVSAASSGISQLHDLQATILAQPNPTTSLKVTPIPMTQHLPSTHHSALSRVLVNTMGKLGRWRRVMHAKSPAVLNAARINSSAIDPEGNSDSDREVAAVTQLQVSPGKRGAAFRSGLDAYLKSANSTGSRRISARLGQTSQSAAPPPATSQPKEVVVKKEVEQSDLNERRQRLMRTASAIPLNSRFADPPLMKVESVSPPRPDLSSKPNTQSPSSVDEISTSEPTERASRLSVSSTQLDSEPAAPPGLDVPTYLPESSDRPPSANSMRRVSDLKGPAKDLAHSDTQTKADVTAVTTLSNHHESGERSAEALEPDKPRVPSQTPTIAIRQATTIDVDAHADAVNALTARSLEEEMNYRPEVVALDDFDLSSSDSSGSDDGDAGGRPGLRRAQRRLPTRRDFEFVRRSVGSVSSLGAQSSDAHSSVMSGGSRASMSADRGPVHEGEILPWHLDLIEDSDDDTPQDVDAALARLEGQIDATTQREKLKKVDRWMSMVASRIASGAAGYPGAIGASDALHEEEELAGECSGAASTAVASETGSEEMDGAHASDTDTSESVESHSESDAHDGDVGISKDPPGPHGRVVPDLGIPCHDEPTVFIHLAEGSPVDRQSVDQIHEERQALNASTPTPPQGKDTDSSVSPVTPTRTTAVTLFQGQGDRESTATAPASTLQPGEASNPRTSIATKRRAQTSSTLMRKAAALGSGHRAFHRSFILAVRSELLAQHLSMIEREMFLTVKFGEIVNSSWAAHSTSREVLDWSAYVKERAKKKVEAKTRGAEPDISDIDALRARFNVMVAFTASELVLTHPDERVMVFSKLVRIAWKCYMHNNFATVVALITGLQSPAVSLTMKRLWTRLGKWETRVFEDLKAFSSPRNNFRFIREAMEALTGAQPARPSDAMPGKNATMPATSLAARGKGPDNGPAPPPGCIPFFGIYLGNLERYRRLPDYIDPTAPTYTVMIDHETGSLSAPLHPEVFSTLAPLPPSVPLEPLINVQKQRLTAGVVKSIVAGQHLATKVSFDLDRKLYQKCLRLKALSPDAQMEVARSWDEMQRL